MINFKPHSREDIVYRVRWLNNPLANRFIGDQVNTDLKEQTEWFDRYEKDENKVFFTIFDEVKPIGFMGLSRVDRQKRKAEVFIMIGEDDYRGRGVGQESMLFLMKFASEKLKLNKLMLQVSKDNLAAIQLYKKLGFAVYTEDDEEYGMSILLEKGKDQKNSPEFL